MKLLRKRTVWVPTLWGWLALLAAGAAALLVAGLHVYSFLAPHHPVGARLLVVEGWMPADELEQAVFAYRDGRYAQIVTTGGPIQSEFEQGHGRTFAERARDYLVGYGIASDAVVAVPAPAAGEHRSYLNAEMVHEWAAHSGVAVDALDVFSSGPHSRRSWLLFSNAFGPRVPVGIIPATPSTYDPQHWWRTSAGAKEVLSEAIAWLWTELLPLPELRGSEEGERDVN